MSVLKGYGHLTFRFPPYTSFRGVGGGGVGWVFFLFSFFIFSFSFFLFSVNEEGFSLSGFGSGPVLGMVNSAFATWRCKKKRASYGPYIDKNN